MSETLTTTLQRLVREGVITDFEIPPGPSPLALHVIVTAPAITSTRRPDYDREIVERWRSRVARRPDREWPGGRLAASRQVVPPGRAVRFSEREVESRNDQRRPYR